MSKTCYQNLKYDKKQLNSIQKLSQATLSKYFLVFQYLSKNVSSDCQLFKIIVNRQAFKEKSKSTTSATVFA